jgi:NOL1/NOP2/fmu family ribosome biogenesis protein
VIPALKRDGILIYSTCSYSIEEDEDIMDWMVKELKVESLKLKVKSGWNIIEVNSLSGTYGYRFWPDKVKGEGFFIACFKKNEDGDHLFIKIKTKAEPATKKEIAIVERWIKKADHHLIKHENTVYTWRESLVNDMNFILSNLRVIYSGVRIGELMRDKLVPDHALAMSKIVSDSVERIKVNYEQAIQYLQRRDMQLETKGRGWQLVNYEGHTLGWINILPNRINNYYPKELRILKDI